MMFEKLVKSATQINSRNQREREFWALACNVDVALYNIDGTYFMALRKLNARQTLQFFQSVRTIAKRDVNYTPRSVYSAINSLRSTYVTE